MRVVPDIARAAIDEFLVVRPRTLALSGGKTPVDFYRRLGEIEFPWAETDVFFADERCVPFDDAPSNFGMARRELLSRVPARVHPMPATTCAAATYEEELRSFFGPAIPAIDLTVLGLGEDGHTASLFPGDPALNETRHLVASVERADYRRMTLTLPVLSAARVAMFLVAGERKREALERLLAGADIPAARVVGPRVVIIADEEAAANHG